MGVNESVPQPGEGWRLVLNGKLQLESSGGNNNMHGGVRFTKRR